MTDNEELQLTTDGLVVVLQQQLEHLRSELRAAEIDNEQLRVRHLGFKRRIMQKLDAAISSTRYLEEDLSKLRNEVAYEGEEQ